MSRSNHQETALQAQLTQFATFVIRGPAFLKQQLAPFCYQLHQEFSSNSIIQQMANNIKLNESQPATTEHSQNLLRNILDILQTKHLPILFQRLLDRMQASKITANGKKHTLLDNKQNFQKIQMLHPDYDIYYKLSKQQREHHLAQHHPKPKTKYFFSEPRFIVRVGEFAHYRSNELMKGNILFLHYAGNIITGSKTYAVSRDRNIQVWSMDSNQYPLPDFSAPPNPDDPPKQVQEKRQQVISAGNFSLGCVLMGHTEKITCLSFSSDEYYILSGSVDRSVRLWCVRTKSCLCHYRGHSKTIWDVNFSQSGYYFLSGSADGLMMLWKTDEPQVQRIYNHQNDVYKVSFAKDPSYLISAGQNNCIKIWRTLQADLVRTLRLDHPVINFNLGFSGVYLVTIQSDGKITLFDLLHGDIVNSFYYYQQKSTREGQRILRPMLVHDVSLSEDQRQLALVGGKYVVLYSMERLEMKVHSNIYANKQDNYQSQISTRIAPREVIYMGIQTNLTFCGYQHKNLLVVAGSGKN